MDRLRVLSEWRASLSTSLSTFVQCLSCSLKYIPRIPLSSFHNLIHLFDFSVEIIWPNQLPHAHCLQLLVKCAPRVAHGVSCLVHFNFSTFDCLFARLFCSGRDSHPQLQGAVEV